MRPFEIALTKPSGINDNRLINALSDGNITARTDSISNTFPVSKDNVPNLIKDWEARYPELKAAISFWKYGGDSDDGDTYGTKKFEVDAIERGRKVLFVFLGMRPTPNNKKFECFELCVEYKFEAYRHQRRSERIGAFGRILIGITTLGLSELEFASEDANYKVLEEDNKKLIQTSDVQALAAMLIAKNCPELSITWK